MARKILILGASYGSLLGTKLVMAGHDVTLVCRNATADLINAEGTEVRIKLKGEDTHRAIRSADEVGRLDARTPQDVDPAGYDMVALAMQEPQYAATEIRILMRRIAQAGVPCLSIMNMPPLPYLRRLTGLDPVALEPAYKDASIWDLFEPGLVSLCSPDPQAFRPPEEAPNVLHVGLPTNFKAATFADPAHTAMLEELAADIDAVRLDGQDVPVKLRVHDSLFVPLAKWAMLLAGNYRCLTLGGERAIQEAVHDEPAVSKSVYQFVNTLAQRLGADPADQVPFEKYANAARSLMKPSSAARAVRAGATDIERVDRLVQLIAGQVGMAHPVVDATVRVVNARINRNIEAVLDAADARDVA
ncbi:MAG: 2-dehydropantoate 2-reductase N-terminal domain-containing protein [Pseudomonadota bacterium]